MHITGDPAALIHRILTSEFFDSMDKAYQMELLGLGYPNSLLEYETAKAALRDVLSKTQKAKLTRMERLYQTNLHYAHSRSFQCGIYAAFEQYFSPTPSETPFSDLVEPRLNLPLEGEPKLNCHNLLEECQSIISSLEAVLNEEAKKDLETVYSWWENRQLGVSRHSFYAGYRLSLSIMDSVAFPKRYQTMLKHVLLTEYDLGFTLTREEKEKGMDFSSKTYDFYKYLDGMEPF